jgi:hypothetical protein
MAASRQPSARSTGHAVEGRADHACGLLVGTFCPMCVDLHRRRAIGVPESSGHRRHGHSGVEELRGLPVTQVVQPHSGDAGRPTRPIPSRGDQVAAPRLGAVGRELKTYSLRRVSSSTPAKRASWRAARHAAFNASTVPGSKVTVRTERVFVGRSPTAPGSETWLRCTTSRSSSRSTSLHRSPHASPRRIPGGGDHAHVQPEQRIERVGGLDQRLDLGDGRRVLLALRLGRSGRQRRNIARHEPPSLGLAQRGADHRMDLANGRRRQAPPKQRAVQPIDEPYSPSR